MFGWGKLHKKNMLGQKKNCFVPACLRKKSLKLINGYSDILKPHQ